MKFKWIEKEFTYDGSQLRSLFAYMNHGVQGDSVVAWRGPCQIPTANIVDGEDLLAGEKICGGDMIHFIVEKFQSPLFEMVCLQRLFTAIAQGLILELKPEVSLIRRGDDLWLEDKKLSISIASLSPVSGMIHFALNVTNEGTPVKTLSLGDLQLDSDNFAKELGRRFAEEVNDISSATTKVRGLS